MQPSDLQRLPDYFHSYVNLVKEQDLNSALDRYQIELIELLKALPEDKWDYRYAPGKWTIKDIVQHIIDNERIFCYRALCFARGDKNDLPGYDENVFAAAAGANARTADNLMQELHVVQKSSALLFRSFTQEQLEKDGKASGCMHFVRGMGFIIIGHALHHMNIIRERYL